MQPETIPSKPKLHDAFLSAIAEAGAGQLLDLGCGDGRLTAELHAQHPGLRCLGVDVNVGAIAHARARVAPGEEGKLAFDVGDISQMDLGGQRFDVVLLQLVLSVVGGPEKRLRLLRAARALLAQPGGRLLISVSGASADINEEYAELYRRDEPLTREARTYFSRAADGTVLYPTHHFSEAELRDLLATVGLAIVSLAREREASSRRPDQAAWFFYAIAATEDASDDAEMPPPPQKRARRAAIAPGSEAFTAALCVGIAACKPFDDGRDDSAASDDGDA